MDYDVIIIGAGPAGCTLAAGLCQSGLRIALIEKQTRAALESPQYDGREIALSKRTADILERYGIWQRIADSEVSPIRAAKVLDGEARTSLDFDARARTGQPIGRLVSNHVIRRAAFSAAMQAPDLQLMDACPVSDVTPGPCRSLVYLEDGSILSAALVVAADTRFSTVRRQCGIAASMHDFGQTMIVARMTHTRSHDQVSWECFFYGATLAILPLNGKTSSVVLTLPHYLARDWMNYSADDYGHAIGKKLGGILGDVTLDSERTAYPLVGVYANRFVGDGVALVGDAAVGMHPVTAHGFNFCVTGAEALARRVTSAARNGKDIRSRQLLRAYEAEHRFRTRPLYEATQRLVQLYTAETAVTKLARKFVLRAGKTCPPARLVITSLLSRSAA
ncbi:MAG: hypothetical protein COW29_02215 [Rhodobacterales bacterium CG15_BIG_FIL_POST_REV_8_21_14_020_59_13]|nr:MAG: hypothetical protein COW29_02215 [Rhodobacterales bacterium CG15_BIG_FIL_POST_REV_8_21_14_020_59_13]